MDFCYPAEVERFRTELRDWLSDNLTDELVKARRSGGRDDAAFEMLRAWNQTMADAGWAAVSWPREYGGRGATVLEQLVYTEETTRARAPLPLNVIGLNNIAPAIMQYGTEAQKQRLLPRMMRADDIWCQGMSEPDAGSDLAALRTRAVRDGDDFVVTGQKIWTSLGHRADWCQLYVRTDPDAPKHKGISCLIVDMTLPGIEARPRVTLGGDADFAEVFFHDVRVPADALLGPLNAGWQVATTTLSHERAGAARLYAEMQVRLERSARRRHRRAGRPGHAAAPRRTRGADQISGSAVPAVDFGHPARRVGTGGAGVGQPGQNGVGRDRAGPGRAGLRRAGLPRRRAGVGELPADVALADHRGRHHADQQEHHRPTGVGVAAQMNLELTDEQVALRDTTRRFLAEKAPIAHHVRRLLDDPTGIEPAVWRGGLHRAAGARTTRRGGHDDGRGRDRGRRAWRRAVSDVAAVVDDVLIAACADALGAARAVMDLAVEYAKTRTQFGQPIGSFQAVQHLCVDMYETVELARSGVIHALWVSDAPDGDERHLAALRAKAFAGRLAGVADTAIQVFGGIGYTWEHDAHLYLKRLLGYSAFLGGPDRYLTEVGARLAKRGSP